MQFNFHIYIRTKKCLKILKVYEMSFLDTTHEPETLCWRWKSTHNIRRIWAHEEAFMILNICSWHSLILTPHSLCMTMQEKYHNIGVFCVVPLSFWVVGHVFLLRFSFKFINFIKTTKRPDDNGGGVRQFFSSFLYFSCDTQ